MTSFRAIKKLVGFLPSERHVAMTQRADTPVCPYDRTSPHPISIRKVVGFFPSERRLQSRGDTTNDMIIGPVNEYHRLKLRSPRRDWPTTDASVIFGLNGALPAVAILRMTGHQYSLDRPASVSR